jgi:hypothetical protein
LTASEILRDGIRSVEVDASFSEAVVTLSDGSRLCFCHRVGERWAKAFRGQDESKCNAAEGLLNQTAMFRLNAKHLDVHFDDGSRFERKFR